MSLAFCQLLSLKSLSCCPELLQGGFSAPRRPRWVGLPPGARPGCSNSCQRVCGWGPPGAGAAAVSSWRSPCSAAPAWPGGPAARQGERISRGGHLSAAAGARQQPAGRAVPRAGPALPPTTGIAPSPAAPPPGSRRRRGGAAPRTGRPGGPASEKLKMKMAKPNELTVLL